MSGGGSPSSTTSTKTSALPSWLNNANSYGAGQAKSLYEQGGAQYYPGQTTAPLSSIQENYLTNADNLGQNGNSALNAGTNYATSAANGDYLNSNPHLDQTFNQAANAVQNRVGSQFAGSGRNLEASIPVQNDQMNQLATSIYGGNYANERGMQAQAAGMSPQLNYAQQSNIRQQGQAGGVLQNQAQNYANNAQHRFDYNANLPQNNLNNYMNSVNSMQHGTSQTKTQPLYQNRMGSSVGGAMVGSQVGSGMGTYGSLIGTGLGALAGYYGS